MPAKVRAADQLSKEVEDAIAAFKKMDSGLAKFFQTSVGYVVFPRIAKGGAGVGAAHGDGEVFAKGGKIGEASLTQVTLGFQLGGQVYSEVIFFEDERTLEDFKASKMKLSAQVSAVAAAEGVAEHARYQQGIAVFTMAINGLMFEASAGGQKFKFRPSN
jgi:lipid-binding SYLF domain-containing protein